MTLPSLLPPNATPLEQALEQAMIALAAAPVPLRVLWSPDLCPVELLPWLAWSLSIDTWDVRWPESVKRARIRSAIQIQRTKGTVKSVRDIVAVFGGAIALREWWQKSPAGDPFTFELILSLTGETGTVPGATYVDQVIDEIERTKPLRSRFTFTQAIEAAGAIGVTGAGRFASYVRLSLSAPAAA